MLSVEILMAWTVGTVMHIKWTVPWWMTRGSRTEHGTGRECSSYAWTLLWPKTWQMTLLTESWCTFVVYDSKCACHVGYQYSATAGSSLSAWKAWNNSATTTAVAHGNLSGAFVHECPHGLAMYLVDDHNTSVHCKWIEMSEFVRQFQSCQ